MPDHPLALLQRAPSAAQAPMPHLPVPLRRAARQLRGAQRRQRVRERVERAQRLLALARERGGVAAAAGVALGVLLCGGGGGGGPRERLGDARDEGGVLDQALVGLGLQEGVGYGGVWAVDFAREERVREALGCFEAEGLAFLGGGWGLEGWRVS